MCLWKYFMVLGCCFPEYIGTNLSLFPWHKDRQLVHQTRLAARSSCLCFSVSTWKIHRYDAVKKCALLARFSQTDFLYMYALQVFEGLEGIWKPYVTGQRMEKEMSIISVGLAYMPIEREYCCCVFEIQFIALPICMRHATLLIGFNFLSMTICMLL